MVVIKTIKVRMFTANFLLISERLKLKKGEDGDAREFLAMVQAGGGLEVNGKFHVQLEELK
jgi:hypothetical protein